MNDYSLESILSKVDFFNLILDCFQYVYEILTTMDIFLCKSRPRGYKTFFMLNSVKHELYSAHKCSMQTIIGTLTFISMINATSERLKGNSNPN